MAPRRKTSPNVKRRDPSSNRPSRAQAGLAGGGDIEPLQQGDLDGLCGVYAVVNAFRLLCPELDRRRTRTLFKLQVTRLGEICFPAGEYVSQGIEHTELWALVRLAQRFIREEFGIRITAKPLVLRRTRRRFDEFWSVQREAIDKGGVSLLALYGVHNHWTVGCRATERSLRLFDSDSLKLLRRSGCSFDDRKTIHWIGPENVVFLRRPGRRRV